MGKMGLESAMENSHGSLVVLNLSIHLLLLNMDKTQITRLS